MWERPFYVTDLPIVTERCERRRNLGKVSPYEFAAETARKYRDALLSHTGRSRLGRGRNGGAVGVRDRALVALLGAGLSVEQVCKARHGDIRKLPLDDRALRALEEWNEVRSTLVYDTQAPFICTVSWGYEGKPLTRAKAYRTVLRLAAKAGIPNIAPPPQNLQAPRGWRPG